MTLMAWMKWHRWAGLCAGLFILLLCVTGILLNHAAGLGLARHYVQSPWLLDLYGIAPAAEPVAYAVGGHHVALAGETLYFDAQAVPVPARDLLGAVALQDQVAVAVPGKIVILAPDGAVIESLGGAEGVPADLRRIGAASGGRLVVEAGAGILAPDLDTLRWDPGTPDGVAWAQPAPLPPALAERIAGTARERALTLERVLLDLHSGRIATRLGPWFMDLVALVLASLVLSGLWIWWRR